ncbi:MAG TPA: metallophosphoesterase [Prolixibacteraceae bacterium]|nr:metallophosphoesterase [Prolixibacteraceae bacterium]
MRLTSFLIFFSIVLLIYGSVNYYIFARGLQAFSLNGSMRRWFIVLFWTIAACFVTGSFMERAVSSALSEWIYRIGSFWMAYMLYLFLAVFVIDLVRLANHFFHFLPEFSQIMKFRLGLGVFGLASVIVIGGHINALWINVKEIPLEIHKKINGNPEVKILMASDIHLGALIGERREKKLLDIVNEQKPDMVLLCGDLVDGEIAPVLRKNLGKHIQEIKTPLGVYAILGNHEYIGGEQKTLPYLKSINIKVLIDSLVTLPNGIQLIGRNDRSARGVNQPKPLKELMASTNPEYPIIVMNHQPFNLSEASDLNVDLHLSGHTHHGQLWPFNYITKAIFELSWGYLKKGNTNFYVSSGFGTWGPSVRTGNRPEVVIFKLRFDR